MKKTALCALTLMLLLPVSACNGLRPHGRSGADASDAELARARSLYENGNHAQAMIACIDIARKDPDRPGLADLQAEIARAVHKSRLRAAELRKASTTPRMVLDVERQKILPDTYQERRRISGETSSLRTPSSKMEEVLRRRINIHLDSVDLNSFVLAIGASENVNIIVDGALSQSDKTMTLHADDTPLLEILSYVSRNLEVEFAVGENMLWATPRQPQAGTSTLPMETRVYRLRKGISSEEVAGADDGIDIVRAVERFVPKTDGADLWFSKKAHALIAKNTRESLTRVEEIIEALDVVPPQILIEARFITTSISDLRELGIDWFLNSPIAVTKKRVWQDGRVTTATETQIDGGGAYSQPVKLLEFPKKDMGLNLSYRGLLTDPMFQAVLHALETSGKARTLSVPRVTTVNNREASIRIGQDFSYFENFDVQSIPDTTFNGGGQSYRSTLVPVGSPTVKELGIELKVTPSTGADMRSIRLNMLPKITDFVRFEYYDTGSQTGARTGNSNVGGATNSNSGMIKLPIFSTSEMETEVTVRSGETVVMGGLITTKENKTLSKVPILSSIPILGRFFQHDIVEEQKDNLLIFVTATILSETGESLIPIDDVETEEPGAGTATEGSGTGSLQAPPQPVLAPPPAVTPETLLPGLPPPPVAPPPAGRPEPVLLP